MSRNQARVSLAQPSDGVVFWKGATKRMPVGISYIAAACLKAEHSVRMVDASLHDLTTEETVRQILENDPHVVGFTCTTPLYHRAVEAIKLIRKLSPTTAIVMGGPHVSYLPHASLETSGADFICLGEGEESMPAIVDCVMGRKDPSEITGIVYKWKGHEGETRRYLHRVQEKKERARYAPPVDLNKIPIPAREVFEYLSYGDPSRGKVGAQADTVFSRGCPGKCAFCGAADTLVRWRDIDNVIAELRRVKELGIHNVFCHDDTYTVNRKRVLELSRRIKEENLGLDISIMLRLDQTDPEVCDALWESGVRHVHPGIESGNEKIIKAIGKGPRESKENMRAKVRLLQQYAWKVRCSFVFGMPNETEEQILETIAFATELSADENAFSLLVPYPDSPLWAYAKREGKVQDTMDFSRFLYYRTVGVNLSAVPTNRLLALHKFAYEHAGNPAYAKNDVSISSGNRPHALLDPKELENPQNPADVPNLPHLDFGTRHDKILNRTLRDPEEYSIEGVRRAFEEYVKENPIDELEEDAMV